MATGFFESNFFIGLATLIVGVAAYGVYARQKRDAKRNAANIVLLEIERAEQQIQIINQAQQPGTLNENLFLMKSASWEKYRHLFVKNFDRNEWDKLTDFYDKCQRYDEAVRYNNTFFKENAQELTTNLHRALADYAKDCAEQMSAGTPAQKNTLENAYLAKRKQFIDLYMNVDPDHLYMHFPMKPINDAKAVLDSIEPSLSLTSVGIKLKRLARTSGGTWQRLINGAGGSSTQA